MIGDNQKASFFQLINHDIPELFEKLSYENEAVEIKYNYVEFDTVNTQATSRGTIYNTVRTNVSLINKYTGECRTVLIDLLKIPVYTSTGYIINNNSRQILDLYQKANGWYVLQKKEKDELQKYVELSTSHGKKLTFRCKDKIVRVENDKERVDVAVFLKALSGKSYTELADLLGVSNPYVLANFVTDVEFSRPRCISDTLKCFVKHKIEATEKQLMELQTRMFNERFLYLEPESRIRIRRSSSFSYRALNKTLASDVEVNGRIIKKGTILYQSLLEEIDSTDIDTLKVYHENRIFELKKYKIMDKLTFDEILTVLNMYFNTLAGMEKYDSEYELTDRCLKPFHQAIIRILSEQLNYLTVTVLNHLASANQNGSDLITLTSVLADCRIDTDRYITEITKADSKELQMADNINPIAYVAKGYKITTDYSGNAPEAMIKVQDTQQGRLDPIESPESQKVGLVHYKTLESKIDKDGALTTPYFEVKNGVLSEDVVYLRADQEQNKYIAEWCETFTEPLVKAKYNGTVVTVPKDRISYKEHSPIQSMSPSRSLIPFQNHASPKRLNMASNHQKQAVVINNPERPLVSTGCDSLLGVGVYTARAVLEDYYNENEMTLRKQISKDDFLELPLKLVSTKIAKNYRHLNFTVEVNRNRLSPRLVVPFIQKTSEDSLNSCRINVVPDNIYKGDDVVAHSNGVDTREYKLLKNVDFGGLKLEDNQFRNAIGVGKNMLIGFKTWESSTIDDAIVLSSDVVGSELLSSVMIKKEEAELMVTNETVEKFGFIDNKRTDMYMQYEGIPRVGTYLKPGSLVIAKYRTDKLVEGKDTVCNSNKSVYLDNYTEGEVVFAEIKDNKAIVLLATSSPVELGDKLSGRHGNKGVIAKIVPKEHMPFDPVTGMRLQMILNPLGIPSRMNISQILECILGFAMKKSGQVAIISPFKQDGLQFVKEQAEKYEIRPMMLRDGRTGQMFKRPMNVGYMYILVLSHKVKKKIHSINIPKNRDKVFIQAKKGRKLKGGQSIGEMESWCLMAVGAHKVLDDLYTIHADDVEKTILLKNYIASNPNDVQLEGDNHNYHLFQTFMRCMGIEVVTEEDGYVFKPLTDKMIMSLAPRDLDVRNIKNLHDSTIFGNTYPDTAAIKARSMWGWIDLECEIVHPFWLVKSDFPHMIMVDKAEMSSSKKKDKYVDIEDDTITRRNNVGSEYNKFVRTNMTDEMMKRVIGSTACIKFLSDGPVYYSKNLSKADPMFETGIKAIVKLIKMSSMETALSYYQVLLEKATSIEERVKVKRMISSIESFKKNGITLQDFIVSKLPIMPAVFRPEIKGMKNVVQDFDKLYQAIFSAVCMYKNDHSPQSQQKVYDRVLDFVGLEGNRNKALKFKSLLTWFTGKDTKSKKDDGKIRDNTLSKRIMFSARTVIIPARNTKMKPTQLGVPISICVSVWELHIVAALRMAFSESENADTIDWVSIIGAIASKNNLKFKNLIRQYGIEPGKDPKLVYDKVLRVIDKVLEEAVVVFGRQPSLHKFSIRAYRPLRTDGKAIEIHPLVCKGYNADFDGDQMWLAALLTNEAKQEALDKLSPSKGVINPKDSSCILEHTQDICLGCYFATMLYNNVINISKDSRYNDIKYYSSLPLMKSDVEAGILEPHDLVCLTSSWGDKYLSTAGRIWFNSIVPNGFTKEPFENHLDIPGVKAERYKALRYDGLLAGDDTVKEGLKYTSLKRIALEIYEECGEDSVDTYFQYIMEFGLYFSDISGISFTMEDLVEHSKTDKFIEKARELQRQVDNDFYAGLITESDRKSALIKIYNACTSSLKSIYMSQFNRNNNLFIMKDSGARGNENQIMQISGLIGVISKTSTESLETPVLSNYTRGVSSFEAYLASYGTRIGIASTQLETKDAGYATRKAVFMTSGFKIVEQDCGKESWDFKIKYGDVMELFKNGKSLNNENTKDSKAFENLLRGNRLSDDEMAEKLLKNFLPIDRTLTTDCVKILLKNKIKSVNCEEGVFTLKYKLAPIMKSLLLFRKARNLPHLLKDSFISPKTLKHIEEENLEIIEVRTMLDCKSVDGVCAECFGLKYDTKKLPKVNEVVGIESAQSVGEPAAQLTMSLINQGGIAGDNVSSGVTIFLSLLDGKIPKKDLKAELAHKDGYVKIDRLGDLCLIDFQDGSPRIKTSSNKLLVSDGEYVTLGTPMTVGYVEPNSIGYNANDPHVIRLRQLNMLELYYNTFTNNKINVNARHFEVFTRVQTSIVEIVDSDNSDFIPGHCYDMNAVLNAVEDGSKIQYLFSVSKQTNVVEKYSGSLSLLGFERIPENLAKMVIMQKKTNSNSPIGKIFIGQSLVKPELRKLTLPEVEYRKTPEKKRIESAKEEIAPTLVEVVAPKDPLIDLNSMDIFGEIWTKEDAKVYKEESEEPTFTLEETHKEEGKSTGIEKPKSTKMDAFV